MHSTNKIKQTAQEDIQMLEVTNFSCGGIKEYDPKFNAMTKKIMLMTWLPSMLPLAIFQVAHFEAAKDSIASVAQTCLALGLLNVIFSLIFVLAMFKSIDTYLNFKHHIKNVLKLGLSVDNLIKNTVRFMCILSVIFSLGVAFSFEPITIFWAWPTAFLPSLVLAKFFYAVEKRRLGLTTLIRKIKRRVQEEHQQPWMRLWPNMM